MRKSWCMWTCLTVVLFVAALLSSLQLQPIQTAVAQDKAASKPSDEKPFAEPVFQVLSPLGENIAKTTTMAPRLDTLAGKTVGLVWNRTFKSDVTLPAIAEALKKQFPTIKIIPYAALPMANLPEPPDGPKTESEALQAAFKAKGCDAIIAGNGG